MKDLTQKYADIFAARVAGEDLQAISDKYGVSVFGVGNILERFLKKALSFDEVTRKKDSRISDLEAMASRQIKKIQLLEAGCYGEGPKQIATLGLPKRVENALAKFGITTVSELAAMDEMDVLRVPDLGRKSLNQIRAAFAEEHIAQD